MEKLASIPGLEGKRFWIDAAMFDTTDGSAGSLREVRRTYGSAARYTTLGTDRKQFLVLENGNTKHLALAALVAHASLDRAKPIAVIQSFIVDADSTGSGKKVYWWIRAEDGRVTGAKEVIQWDRDSLLTTLRASGLLRPDITVSTEIYGDQAALVVDGAQPLTDLINFYEDWNPEWSRVRSLALRNTLIAASIVGASATICWYGWTTYSEQIASKVEAERQRVAARVAYDQEYEQVVNAPSPRWLADNVLAAMDQFGPYSGSWRLSGVRCSQSECELGWVPNSERATFLDFIQRSSLSMDDVEVWQQDEQIADAAQGALFSSFKSSMKLQLRYRMTPPIGMSEPTDEEMVPGNYWEVIHYCQALKRYEVDCETSTPNEISIPYMQFLGDKKLFSKAEWTLVGALQTLRPVVYDLSEKNWMKGRELAVIRSPQGGFRWKMDGYYAVN